MTDFYNDDSYDAVDSTGIHTKTLNQLAYERSEALKGIYGADINLESSSPDGQLMMIECQAAKDVRDLIEAVYNSFDPDQAFGTVLDQRVAINGIQRQGGTYTVTPITIVTDRIIPLLKGLDLHPDDPYTVADDAGTKWVLQTTQTSLASGTHSLNFQAALPGATLTTVNTITIPVTIVLGVTSVNNPSTYTTLGTDEESDVALKVRRQKSIALPSLGFIDSLDAMIANVPGVTYHKVYENNENVADSDGTPPHTVWVIVGGSYLDANIADAIFKKKSSGCGMRGNQSLSITRADGSIFLAKWDEVENEDLYIQFTATPIDGVTPVNTSAILSQLPGLVDLLPGEKINATMIGTLVQQIDPNCLVTGAGLSKTSSGYTSILTPTYKYQKFSTTSGRINIL